MQHHGNILVRKRAGTKNSSEIVLLDHGLYCYIGSSDRKNLCNLWKAIILKDENKMKLYSKKLNVEGIYFNSLNFKFKNIVKYMSKK